MMALDEFSAAYLNKHGFEVTGDCTDREQRRRYPMVTEWGSAGPYRA
jgi:hypothetical protein